MATQFKIEKGVPKPSGWGRYPFRAMEVGDSFFAAGVTATRLSNASSSHRYDGRRYTARTVDGGARVWRIA